MTPERFHTLVGAYGADPRRWPPHEREDALAWARSHRAEAQAALEEALELDAWLARDTIAPPTRAFVEQIAATAPGLAPARAAVPKRRLWWSGAAFAGAGLAGALAGALVMSFFVLGSAPHASYDAYDAHDSSYLGTGFGGSSADWSDE
ncbi:hypothetical protein [Paraburkholderia acidipaludis]|uniref:hypothetical protein n=1 Tax=Paraburkholderia acidipaludis TaxID=660537 RepID=UPI0004887732|nr:hypothetical protein [Paraburkholderia acidipaludis]